MKKNIFKVLITTFLINIKPAYYPFPVGEGLVLE